MVSYEDDDETDNNKKIVERKFIAEKSIGGGQSNDIVLYAADFPPKDTESTSHVTDVGEEEPSIDEEDPITESIPELKFEGDLVGKSTDVLHSSPKEIEEDVIEQQESEVSESIPDIDLGRDVEMKRADETSVSFTIDSESKEPSEQSKTSYTDDKDETADVVKENSGADESDVSIGRDVVLIERQCSQLCHLISLTNTLLTAGNCFIISKKFFKSEISMKCTAFHD